MGVTDLVSSANTQSVLLSLLLWCCWLLRVLGASTQGLVINNFTLFLDRLHKVCPFWRTALLNLQMFVHSLWVVVLYLVLEMAKK